MTGTSAVFIGDGSLLIQCADLYRNAGHLIHAVATRSPTIRSWAEVHGIFAVDLDAEGPGTLLDLEFEYLFSVANLEILPAALTGRAGRLAINFHDALLPRYAGLNATSWALMAQEEAHGVTWHEMTSSVDAGRIVRQASFSVAEDETAWSLNARCYEAGLATFGSIVDDLTRGQLRLAEQSGNRSYFGRHHRPRELGMLDFSHPARKLAALVRALDFGRYFNPLSYPKFLLDDKVVLVRTARVSQRSSAAPHGTVLQDDGDSLRIATADDDIVLGGCMDQQGRGRTVAAAEGKRVGSIADRLRQEFATRIPQIARGEGFWCEVFPLVAPVVLPYPQTVARAHPGQRNTFTVRVETSSHGAGAIAGFYAWLSALTGQERISTLYTDHTLLSQAGVLKHWLSPWVPLTLATSPSASAAETVECAEIQIARCREAGPYPSDLPLRLRVKRPHPVGLDRVGVCLGQSPKSQDFDLLLEVGSEGKDLALTVDSEVFLPATAASMASHLGAFLQAFNTASDHVGSIPLVPAAEAKRFSAANATTVGYDTESCVADAVSLQANRTPQQPALDCQGRTTSYRELDDAATAFARQLAARGLRSGNVVGLCLERSAELVIAMLGIMKAGGAYLPLDPAYPHDRLAFMIEDSKAALVVTSTALAGTLAIAPEKVFLFDRHSPIADDDFELPRLRPGSAAYVIYTSGSTGRPKGVVVTHRSVMNFFAGMSQRVPTPLLEEGEQCNPPGRWLAVTSLSFDISVLELVWTLTRGFTVVLHSPSLGQPARHSTPEFSLFYFGSDNASAPGDRYKLLLEGAKFADREGFAAVWTPERHFHAFGELYPNPALASAAIAAITQRVKIRAGSCVLPLHHPIRVAEDWAFVDNISQGRAGVSFAAGWQPNDFAIAPAAFATRKADMLANIALVRRLWRGEAVAFPGPHGNEVAIQTLPRPIQKELPIWLTAAGNPETFRQAGEMGCHLLTHLLGQSIDDVAEKLKVYRSAWRAAGHPGAGHVTLMVHAFVGQDEDEVRETVREPMKAYLRSSVDLIKQAAWSFPAFVERGAQAGKSPVEVMDSQPMGESDMDALLEHAFSRYYRKSALFGTPARCLALVEKFQDAGVDEIACLIDFGLATDTVLAHLHDLKELMAAFHALPASRAIQAPAYPAVSISEQIVRDEITHLQCTPSMATMLTADAAGRAALSQLSVLLVGGEALPLSLAKELRSLVPGTLLNMYGPTETTVWSTTCDLAVIGDFVPLGQPIANTTLAVHTPWGMECPAWVPGELLIGGDGVAQGYLMRDELTAERFIPDPAAPGRRLYRTGDLVRRHPQGELQYLGRIDHQVKIRGHRIELGEIEAALLSQAGVNEAVVVAVDGAAGDKTLAAYVTRKANAALDSERLRQALAQQLPEIMVPRTVRVLAAFPMTPNGKVDRNALPALAARPAVAAPVVPVAPAVPAPVTPGNDFEPVIAAIWKEVLGLPAVGRSDNFFDLGGHSLLVVQVQRRLREATGHEVSITDMFRLTSIEALAAYLSGTTTRTAVTEGLNRAQARRVVMRSRPTLQSNSSV